MDTTARIASPKANAQAFAFAKDVLSVFNNYPAQIKVLSLDCFDTLLWRNVAEPKDVFYDLIKQPTLQKLGMTKLMRVEAENLSYNINKVKYNAPQSTLRDIYRACFPNAEDELIKQLAEEELAAEIQACYAFSPVVALIRAARAKNIKVIIVSDTYLEKPQLTRLLASKLPADVMAAISEIFCSCEYRKSKAEGLFQQVLQKMNMPAQFFLHVGDNQVADFAAPKQFNMNALHLLHHEEKANELFRMRAIAASLLDNSIRVSRALSSPFQGLFAMQLNHAQPENLIGYATAGPILYAFAKFIQDKVASLKNAGKNPKVLFLLRDGYLPSLVCETLAGEAIGARVRISRFVSYAAAFRTKSDVERYLANNVHSLRFKDMARQLLLPEKIATSIINKITGKNNAIQEFCRYVLQPDNLQIIFKESTAYCKRLLHYLEKEAGIQAGDTLVLVDLGYTGTTQNKLTPVFKSEMNIDLVGCYLLSLHTHENAETHDARYGLFDPTVYDNNALTMLVTYIAIFEQICTCNESSVVDYDEQGNPIYSNVTVDTNQQNKLTAIQAEAVRFVQDVEAFCQDSQLTVSADTLRDVAASNLCRFIFFLTQTEREYLQSFKFELNLGTKDLLGLMDVEKGLTSLRRRGWLNSLKENDKEKRMNYPAEWRAINYNLTLSLMMEHRFDLKVALTDLSQQREKIAVVISDGQQVSNMSFDALPTYDGYFSVLVPIADERCEIGICFGQSYKWIEIESANLIKLEYLYTSKESQHAQDASAYFTMQHMQMHDGGLFTAESPTGMLVFVPSAAQIKFQTNPHVLQLVFRPIVRK